MNQRVKRIPDGQKTRVIYGKIKQKKYEEAIKLLNQELKFTSRSQVISLLGYCYFKLGDFVNSARIYEELSFMCPTQDNYKYYQALSLYKMQDYESAMLIVEQIKDEGIKEKVIPLLAYIKYDVEDFESARTLIADQNEEDLKYIVLRGALEFKRGKSDQALEYFNKAQQMDTENSELIYNKALVHYEEKNYEKCMKNIADIVERGVRQNQDICIGEGSDQGFVNDVKALKKSALIETFNLKAAIEFNMKNKENAKQAMKNMPRRKDQDLDSVTLMNQALIFSDIEPNESFRKMNFLLQNPPFPRETFANLLLLYAQFEYFDLAADILAENSDLTFSYISEENYKFIETLIFQNNSIENALEKFQEMESKKLSELRRITKQIKNSQRNKDNEALQENLKEYDILLDKYIPVQMAQAKIFWNQKNYFKILDLFEKSRDFCSINDTWKLNMAHVLFQLEKYNESLEYYEQIYEKNFENLLDMPAIVLANLCVSYIMINQNERAEEVMKILEELENSAIALNQKKYYHLCIVNLVIGTLYCCKNNYFFGIQRIIKSFEPIQDKLNTDTWFYAKSCLMHMIQKIIKSKFILQDQLMIEILEFLSKCQEAGEEIITSHDPRIVTSKKTVTYEARKIQTLLLKLRQLFFDNFIMLKQAFIDFPVGKFVNSLTVFLRFYKLTHINISIGENILALTIFFITFPLSFINISILINIFTLAMLLIFPPGSLINVSLLSLISSLSVELIVFKVSNVLISISEYHFALSRYGIIRKLSSVKITIFEFQFTLSMFFPPLKLSFILITIRFFQHSLTMNQIIFESSFIFILIFYFKDSINNIIINPFSFQVTSLCQNQLTLPISPHIFNLSNIFISIFILHDSLIVNQFIIFEFTLQSHIFSSHEVTLTILLIILKVSFILASLFIEKNSPALLLSPNPISLVDIAICIKIIAFTMLQSIFELSLVLVSI